MERAHRERESREVMCANFVNQVNFNKFVLPQKVRHQKQAALSIQALYRGHRVRTAVVSLFDCILLDLFSFYLSHFIVFPVPFQI